MNKKAEWPMTRVGNVMANHDQQNSEPAEAVEFRDALRGGGEMEFL
jgi:hypothetical protein